MISTGNDIIDLKGVNVLRTRQEEFYLKILSSAEIEAYKSYNLSTLPFENFVWLLWSVKESVYKFSVRNFSPLIFSPKKNITRLISLPKGKFFPAFENGKIVNIALKKDDCFCCIVKTETGIYYSRSKVSDEFIFTVVNDVENFDNIWWGIKYISDINPLCQSESVRSFLLERFKVIYPNSNLFISKSPVGYPILNVNGNVMKIPLSFTHHLRLIAYTFCL